MDYVTQYYKNLSEKLNSRVNYLQRMLREDFAAVTNPVINPNAETNFAQQYKASQNMGDFMMQKGKPASRPQGQGYGGLDFDSVFGNWPPGGPLSEAQIAAIFQHLQNILRLWGVTNPTQPINFMDVLSNPENYFSIAGLGHQSGQAFIGNLLYLLSSDSFRSQSGINSWGDVPSFLVSLGIDQNSANQFWRIMGTAMFQNPGETGRAITYESNATGGFYILGQSPGSNNNTLIGLANLFNQNPFWLMSGSQYWYDPYEDGWQS